MKRLLFIIFVFSFLTGNAQKESKTDNDWLNLMGKSLFDSALVYTEEEAALIRVTPSENSSAYAEVLDRLALSHFYLGNNFKSKYYILEEITLREKLRLINDEKYFSSLMSASVICRKSGYYEDALIQIKKCAQETEKIYGAESIQHAETLKEFAAVYCDMGSALNDIVYLRKAIDLYKKTKIIIDKQKDISIRSKLTLMNDMAICNNNIGNFPLAEELFSEIVFICDSVYGKAHPIYATSLNNLGVFYYNNANLIKAERYLNEAVKVYRKSNESETIASAICASNSGAMYYETGNYNHAAELMAESKKIMNSVGQKNKLEYGILLNNIATNYMLKEFYESKENKNKSQLDVSGKMLIKADSLFEANCKMPHPRRMTIGMNTSLWYKMTGNDLESIQLMKDQAYQSNLSLNAVSMTNKMTSTAQIPFNGKWDDMPFPLPEMITVKTTVTDHMIDEEGLEFNRNNQVASTRFLLKLILGDGDKIRKALGPYHPGYSAIVKSFMPLYESIGDYNSEEKLWLEYMKILTHNTLQDFTFLSESEKELYMKTRVPDMDNFLKYSLKRKERNPGITGEAYNFLLLYKGLMLKSSTAMRHAILTSNDKDLIKNYNEWISIQKEISALYSTPVELRTKNVSDLEIKASEIEKNLVKNSQVFSDFQSDLNVTWKIVRDSLSPGEAAIEFTNYTIREKNAGETVVYCALLVRKDSKYPEMIKLFEEKDLLDILGIKKGDDLKKVELIYGTKENPDNRLYKLIWSPIEKHLQDVKTIYISPSGLLNKVSFASLSVDKNVFLCDQFTINLKGSSGKINNNTTFNEADNINALIFGGINYNKDNPNSPGWKYLMGTKTEADAVKSILDSENIPAVCMSEDLATETFLKQNAGNYYILHISTHGFFFPDPNDYNRNDDVIAENTTVTFRGSSEGLNINNIANNQNPLMRSGLILAGANDKMWSESNSQVEDDGVLTAQEVTQIDMRHNNLVVLSACETGLGDIKGSEGVYGLQRAFKMAGVKYIIMSLWQVPDKETVEFMEMFYKKLLKSKDVRSAFNETQKEMRGKYDPYYWGAFVLVE